MGHGSGCRLDVLHDLYKSVYKDIYIIYDIAKLISPACKPGIVKPLKLSVRKLVNGVVYGKYGLCEGISQNKCCSG